jgi:hypothetical protein
MAIYSTQNTCWKPEEVKIINGQPVHFRDVCVHEFLLGDVEDPDLYAAEPLLLWENSEAGKWVMANAQEQPYWIRNCHYTTFFYQFKIMARLSNKNEMFWRLK